MLIVSEVISACGIAPNAAMNSKLSLTSIDNFRDSMHLAPEPNVITSVIKGIPKQIHSSIVIRIMFFLLVLKKSRRGKYIFNHIYVKAITNQNRFERASEWIIAPKICV